MNKLKSFLSLSIIFLSLNSSAYALNEQEKSLLHHMCTSAYAGNLTEKNTNLLGQFIALTDHPEVQAYAKMENFGSIASLFAKNINFTDDIGFMWMSFIEDQSKQTPEDIYYDQRKYTAYVPAAVDDVQPSLAGGAQAKEVQPSLAGGGAGQEAMAAGGGAETLLSAPALTREHFRAYNRNQSFFYSLTIGKFSRFNPDGSTYTAFLEADHLEIWAGCLNTMYLKGDSTEEEIHNFLRLFADRIESLQGREHPVLFLVDPRFYNEYSPIKRQNYKSEKKFLEIQHAVQTKLNDFSRCLIKNLKRIPNLRIHFFNKTLNPMLRRLLRDSRGSVYIDNKVEAYGHDSNLQLPPELIDTLHQRAQGFEMLVSKERTRGLRVATHEQFGLAKQFIDRNPASAARVVLQRWNRDNPQLQIEERE
jgi:hypothetical protein